MFSRKRSMEKFQRITAQPISKHLRGGKQCENRTEMENGEAQLELWRRGGIYRKLKEVRLLLCMAKEKGPGKAKGRGEKRKRIWGGEVKRKDMMLVTR